MRRFFPARLRGFWCGASGSDSGAKERGWQGAVWGWSAAGRASLSQRAGVRFGQVPQAFAEARRGAVRTPRPTWRRCCSWAFAPPGVHASRPGDHYAKQGAGRSGAGIQDPSADVSTSRAAVRPRPTEHGKGKKLAERAGSLAEALHDQLTPRQELARVVSQAPAFSLAPCPLQSNLLPLCGS